MTIKGKILGLIAVGDKHEEKYEDIGVSRFLNQHTRFNVLVLYEKDSEKASHSKEWEAKRFNDESSVLSLCDGIVRRVYCGISEEFGTYIADQYINNGYKDLEALDSIIFNGKSKKTEANIPRIMAS